MLLFGSGMDASTERKIRSTRPAPQNIKGPIKPGFLYLNGFEKMFLVRNGDPTTKQVETLLETLEDLNYKLKALGVVEFKNYVKDEYYFRL